MPVQHVQIADQAGLDPAITSYLNQGFTLANQMDGRATLQKNKPPMSAAIIILGLIIPFFGWAFLVGYIIIHSSKPAAQVVEIAVGEPSA